MSTEASESTRKVLRPLGVAASMADATPQFPNWSYRPNTYEETCNWMHHCATYTDQALDQGKALTLREIKQILKAVTEFTTFAQEDSKVNTLLKGQSRIEEAIKKGNRTEEEHHITLKHS